MLDFNILLKYIQIVITDYYDDIINFQTVECPIKPLQNGFSPDAAFNLHTIKTRNILNSFT